jgi:uncharacterized protein DUF1206
MTSTLPARGQTALGAADRRAHAVARAQRPWLVALSRAGYAARGVVYLLIGVLAAEAAFGRGGDVTDTEGALTHILQAPSGALLLAAVAIGLAGYAVWCALAAALDAEHQGTSAHGALQRAGYAVTSVIYAGLAITAIGLVVGTQAQPNGDQAAQDRTAWLLSQPFGPWLVGAVGLIVLGVGVAHVYKGITFRQSNGTSQISGRTRRWVVDVARAGYVAHGLAMGLVAVFLLVAAAQSRPDEARGLGGALAALLQQPFGPLLLGLLGAGLAAYGAFSLVEARYRRIDVD